MKTIKAKDAKFGRWYQDNDYGIVRCVSESDETKLAGFVTRSGTFRFFGDPREIEHLPECDSFDWQPAAEGSNGVRWYKDEDQQVVRGFIQSKWLRVNNKGWCSSSKTRGLLERRCIEDNDTKLSTAQVLCQLAQAGHNDAWNEARKLAGLSEQEAYLAGQSVCGLSVGDQVRVARTAGSYEMGWRLSWNYSMQAGSYFVVDAIKADGIKFTSSGSYYPYHVLEKIETPADEATPVETPAEVATEIDPGEGWRLVQVGEKLLDSDQFYETSSKTWVPRPTSGSIMQEDYTPQRRRIQPAADHGFAIGDWFKWNDEVRKISGIDGDHVNTECGHRHFAGHITKVTFRPFANAAEFEPFCDEWYRINSTGMMFRISHYNDTAVDSHSYDWLLSNCEFASGRPCGVEVAQ